MSGNYISTGSDTRMLANNTGGSNQRVRITGRATVIMRRGETISRTATIGGRDVTREVRWSRDSSDYIDFVGGSGGLFGKAVGTTVITATCPSGTSASITVHVIHAEIRVGYGEFVNGVRQERGVRRAEDKTMQAGEISEPNRLFIHIQQPSGLGLTGRFVVGIRALVNPDALNDNGIIRANVPVPGRDYSTNIHLRIDNRYIVRGTGITEPAIFHTIRVTL